MEPRGIEPRFAECDSAVIPLDHGPEDERRWAIVVGGRGRSRRPNVAQPHRLCHTLLNSSRVAPECSPAQLRAGMHVIRTKIVATMGPACSSPDMLYDLFEAGV